MSLFAACFPNGGSSASEARHKLSQALQEINGLAVAVTGNDQAILIAQAPYGTVGQLRSKQPENLIGEFHLAGREQLSRNLAGIHSSPALASPSDQDAHLVHRALAQLGTNCLEHLHGSFAFVHQDPESGKILLARDRLGTIPLFYFRDRTGLWVSNSLRALLKSVPVRAQLDKRKLLIKLMGLPEDDFNSTQYKQFHRVPAAHYLFFPPTVSEPPCPRRYWEMGTGSAHAISANFQDNASTLRMLLDGAVQDHIPSEGRVGVELSGGLDSTSISGLTAAHCRDRVLSCSAVFPGVDESDEKTYIDAAVRHQGIANQQFAAPDLDAPAYYEKSLRACGALHLGGNLHIAMHIQEQLAAQGCTVTLNGIDGDNIASHGLLYLKELAEQRRWREFCEHSQSISDIFSYYSDHPQKTFFQNFGRKSLDQQAAVGLRPAHLLHLTHVARLTGNSYISLLRRSISRRVYGFTEPDKPASRLFNQELFNKDLVGEIQDSDSPFPVGKPESDNSEREAQLRSLNSGVTEQYFEILHAISSVNRVYARSPFMKPELIEFCLDVPGEHKLRNGWNRAFLRKGLEAELGQVVAWRRWKSDLSPALKPLIDNHCVPEIRDLLTMPNHNLWDYFDRSVVNGYLTETTRHHGSSGQMNIHRIWSLWAMGRFLNIDSDWTDASNQI